MAKQRTSGDAPTPRRCVTATPMRRPFARRCAMSHLWCKHPRAAGLAKPRARARTRNAAGAGAGKSRRDHAADRRTARNEEVNAVTGDDALSFQRAGVRIQSMRRLRRGLYPVRRRIGSSRTSAKRRRAQRLADFIAQQPRCRLPLRENHSRQGLSLGRARPGAQGRGEPLAAPSSGRHGLRVRACHRRRRRRRVRIAASLGFGPASSLPFNRGR